MQLKILKDLNSIISRLKNDHQFNSSVTENFFKISPKINKNNLDQLQEHMELKEFLLHKDIFYKTKIDYIGFNSYRNLEEKKGKYFKGLFDYISGYEINLDLLTSVDSKIFLSENVNDLLKVGSISKNASPVFLNKVSLYERFISVLKVILDGVK